MIRWCFVSFYVLCLLYRINSSFHVDDSKSETSMGAITVDSASVASTLDNVPNPENLKDGNKWHRVIKHRDLNVLTKYVMGLETYHNYYFR